MADDMESTPPLDMSTLTAEDIPADVGPFIVPDHTASREKRKGGLFGRRRPRGQTAPDQSARAPRARAPKRKPDVPRRKGMFVQPLTNLYTMAGMAFTMRGDITCGTAVIENAENCAKALDELAYNNDAVRRVLWTLVQTSQMGKVWMAHLPILFAISVHHVPRVRDAVDGMGESFVKTMVQGMAPNMSEEDTEAA